MKGIINICLPEVGVYEGGGMAVTSPGLFPPFPPPPSTAPLHLLVIWQKKRKQNLLAVIKVLYSDKYYINSIS